ncbi:hypothetical protein BDBG_04001 [Blastomyces gilchristii SLH14081]|uniref:Uncharacterized protein n=1 Tax=Blastomyces gilchristii (strain SLH14081) TaxID=559298 RepID=A0A179UIW5_BLAGS|nr:uncharacterized protein BDBG_04001 [Blastomyces gilchristii SLH14081]OAT08006.1 hypothetical protein BDBG_04001 [Blastomyces gilchristii SLH14081]
MMKHAEGRLANNLVSSRSCRNTPKTPRPPDLPPFPKFTHAMAHGELATGSSRLFGLFPYYDQNDQNDLLRSFAWP